MAASGKRKREIQDENGDFGDNFQLLRHLGEQKKRKVDDVERKRELKDWFSRPSVQPLKPCDLSPQNVLKLNSSPLRRGRPTSAKKRLSMSAKASPRTKLAQIMTQEKPPKGHKRRLSLGLLPSSLKIKSSDPVSPPLTDGVETRSSFRRRNSLQRIKKPLINIQGSVKAIFTEQARRRSMRGRQDYSLPMMAISGQLDFVRFLAAQDVRMGKNSQRDQYLQQKIDYEIKMRDGTAKLLAASKHPHQMLEAAKNLLTSNARMIAYMTELQRRKTDQVMKRQRSTDGDQVPCKAKISVSDIRIPLMWKDSDHFKNKGDHRRYAMFCLVKIGTEIYDTVLAKEVDRSMTDLTFEDAMVFNDIGPDFECRLEVYSHKLYDDFSIASTPRKLKKKINDLGSSVGKSVGRRLSGLKEEPEFMPNMLLGPKFECIAHGELSLSDVCESVRSHDLVLHNMPGSIPEGSTSCGDVPLFGSFCCRIAAQPQCLVHDTTTGPLYLLKTDGSGWQSCWCRLRNLELTCWESEEHTTDCEPVLVIPITKNTQVSDIPTSLAQREFSFNISTKQGIRTTQHTLAAENQGELTRWWDGLQQHFLDQVMWQQACETKLNIPDASPQRLPSFMKRGSQYSAIAESNNDTDSPMTRILNRLNVADETLDAKARKNKRRSAPPNVFSTPLTTVSVETSTSSLATVSSCESLESEPEEKQLKTQSSIETDV